MKTRRTIKASRTAKSRKRISAMSRFNRATRPVMASRPIRASRRSIKASEWDDNEILRFSELTPEQQQQAVDIFTESTTAFEWFCDDQMYIYKEQVHIDADEFTKNTGIEVDADKLYWSENSQGPYPEWRCSEVFDEYEGTGDGTDFSFSFDGYGREVDIGTIWVYDEGAWDQYYDSYELREDGYNEIADIVDSKLSETQEFVEEVWNLIKDVLEALPDDEWCYDTLEANDYEFEVDADGDVIRMA